MNDSQPCSPKSEVSQHQAVLELFHRRYACKAYDENRLVTADEMATILEAGRLAPSSMGLEPWQILWVRDTKLVEALLPYTWGGVGKLGSATELVVLLGRKAADLVPGGAYSRRISSEVQGLSPQDVEKKMIRMESFLHQDFGLKSDADFEGWIDKQVYLSLANMMFAAALLDVDSTPIEGFNMAEASRVLIEAGAFDPNHFRLVVMVCFGHASGAPRPKLRRDFGEVVREV